MKKKTGLILSFLIASTFTFAQTVSGKLKFGQGQIFEIVYFWTETVYGLGAKFFNKEKVLNIFKKKG